MVPGRAIKPKKNKGGIMKTEIDKDFYCTASRGLPEITCPTFVKCKDNKEECFFRHRKWPTPEQFKEEWGEEWKDDGAVYTFLKGNRLGEKWNTRTLGEAKAIKPRQEKLKPDVIYYIVCACTPFSKPPQDWRP